MIPSYLYSTCLDSFDNRGLCETCPEAVKQAPTGRFFITMGHAGFNTPSNNRDGYKSEQVARNVIARLMRKRSK